LGFHVMYPLLFSDFNDILIFQYIFDKSSNMEVH